MNDFDKKFPGLIPVKNCDSNVVDGVTELIIKKNYPKFVTKSPLKWFFFNTFKLKLDEKGSFIWNLCDGKRNMEQINKLACEKFESEKESMPERVRLFVSQLSRRKLLILYERLESNNS